MSLAGLVLITILAIYFHSNALAVATSGNKTPGTTARVTEVASVEIDQPRVKDVEVGTGWYDPNTMMLHLDIWGHPMVPKVKWQMRANNDDATKVDMPPLNSCSEDKIFEFRGATTTNAVSGEVTTNEIRCIEYRVTPGQSVGSCTFRFKFGPPR
jgi:UDP-N-acetylmuramyl tripeptide synthase